VACIGHTYVVARMVCLVSATPFESQARTPGQTRAVVHGRRLIRARRTDSLRLAPCMWPGSTDPPMVDPHVPAGPTRKLREVA
jgi:hypothetical protein